MVKRYIMPKLEIQKAVRESIIDLLLGDTERGLARIFESVPEITSPQAVFEGGEIQLLCTAASHYDRAAVKTIVNEVSRVTGKGVVALVTEQTTISSDAPLETEAN